MISIFKTAILFSLYAVAIFFVSLAFLSTEHILWAPAIALAGAYISILFFHKNKLPENTTPANDSRVEAWRGTSEEPFHPTNTADEDTPPVYTPVKDIKLNDDEYYQSSIGKVSGKELKKFQRVAEKRQESVV